MTWWQESPGKRASRGRDPRCRQGGKHEQGGRRHDGEHGGPGVAAVQKARSDRTAAGGRDGGEEGKRGGRVPALVLGSLTGCSRFGADTPLVSGVTQEKGIGARGGRRII